MNGVRSRKGWKESRTRRLLSACFARRLLSSLDQYLGAFSNPFYFQGANIILSYCAASKYVKGRTSQLFNLGFSDISLWVLTRQIVSIAKPFGENVAGIALSKQRQPLTSSNFRKKMFMTFILPRRRMTRPKLEL